MKKILFFILAAGFLGFGLIGDSQSFFGKAQDEEKTLMIGQAESIAVSKPTKVAITDPEIIDIPTATEKEIVVIGKAKGRTTFSYSDLSGNHSFVVKVIPEDVAYLKSRVDTILKSLNLPNVYTQAVEEDGKILILGTVNSIDVKERIKSALDKELYKKVVDLTELEEDVLIDISVEVVELSSDAQKELGVNWPSEVTLSEPANRLAWQSLGGLPDALMRIANWDRKTYTEGNENPVTIDLLVREGKAKVLSRPRVVCQSGKEAELLVGGEVPVFTSSVSSQGESTSVEYKEYGIKLKIGPKHMADERIQLSMKVEISEIGTADQIGPTNAPTAKAYPLTKRNVNTQLYLNNGETLVIGGLIKQKTAEDLKKFPWLGDVPVLGMFFRSRSTTSGGAAGSRGNNELFITLTPKIIKNSADKKVKQQPDINAQAAAIQQEKITHPDMPNGMQDYIFAVQRNLLEHTKYPAELLGTGWRGELTLRLVISEVGELKNAEIIKTSGYKVFDQEALDLAKKLTYSMFPSAVQLEEVTIDIPIIYQEKK